MSNTRLSAALLIAPLRPSLPWAAPSTVLTKFSRNHGVRGTA